VQVDIHRNFLSGPSDSHKLLIGYREHLSKKKMRKRRRKTKKKGKKMRQEKVKKRDLGDKSNNFVSRGALLHRGKQGILSVRAVHRHNRRTIGV